MNFTLKCEQEVDGRWIAEVPELPGVLSYGNGEATALAWLQGFTRLRQQHGLKVPDATTLATCNSRDFPLSLGGVLHPYVL